MNGTAARPRYVFNRLTVGNVEKRRIDNGGEAIVHRQGWRDRPVSCTRGW